MKSFSDLPLVEFDPAVALSFEDGIPACVDMGSYDGPQRLSEVLELGLPASGVAELATAAKELQVGRIHVVRQGSEAGGSRLLCTGTHECLAETGDYIAAIAADDALVEDSSGANPVVARFVALLAFEMADAMAQPWARLTAHEVMQRAAGIPLPRPDVFYPAEADLVVDPHWWGLPFSASTAEAEAFASQVASVIDRFDLLRWALGGTDRWMRDIVASVGNLAELLHAFAADRPYVAPVRQLAA